jgi:molybdopterin/thiamine biosynthesis adenylyltransferase/rhodanese-related sulfurtransferase
MSVREVDIDAAIRLAEAGATVVDVREPWEWDAGHIPGAVHIPLGELPSRVDTELPDRSAPLLLYCRSGARSERAAQYLVANGYESVANLKALIERWPDRGGAWEVPKQPLTPTQERRYARQLALPEIGPDGQRRLADGRALIVGAGGLASPAALYLAAAGVGNIGLVDDDRVDVSNLHRQVMHAESRVGQAKVESAATAVRGLNPSVQLRLHDKRLTEANADALIVGHDVVIDATDRIDARYAINDAAIRHGVPWVHGSVYRWEGQVTTFRPGDGPCYRCMHPAPPPEGLAPDCDVAGVVGVVAGLIGMLQAAEALKLLLGVGEPLIGRVLHVDVLSGRFEELRVERDPSCAGCGTGADARVSIA